MADSTHTALLTIIPNPNADWDAELADVSAVLESAAGQLFQYFRGIELSPIRVEPKGGPIVFHERGPSGEYTVRLNTGGRLWAQYSYQFSHEFCHILCRYDREVHPNKWFEESLCELASLFVLRRMAEGWNANPPYPNWRSYSSDLFEYAQNRLDSAPYQCDPPLHEWLEAEREALSQDPYLRQQNTIVAASLLDLFEAHPNNWNAVFYLNVASNKSTLTFELYLAAWRDNAPQEHHQFIEEIAKRLGIHLIHLPG